MEQYKELVERLREITSHPTSLNLPGPNGLGYMRQKVIEAADAIEAQAKRIEELKLKYGTCISLRGNYFNQFSDSGGFPEK